MEAGWGGELESLVFWVSWGLTSSWPSGSTRSWPPYSTSSRPPNLTTSYPQWSRKSRSYPQCLRSWFTSSTYYPYLPRDVISICIELIFVSAKVLSVHTTNLNIPNRPTDGIPTDGIPNRPVDLIPVHPTRSRHFIPVVAPCGALTFLSNLLHPKLRHLLGASALWIPIWHLHQTLMKMIDMPQLQRIWTSTCSTLGYSEFCRADWSHEWVVHVYLGIPEMGFHMRKIGCNFARRPVFCNGAAQFEFFVIYFTGQFNQLLAFCNHWNRNGTAVYRNWIWGIGICEIWMAICFFQFWFLPATFYKESICVQKL